MPSALLVRAVFGALVLATFAAFFITQRLKSSAPVVERVRLQAHVSPNGDGRKDQATLRFDLPEPREVTVAIVNSSNEEVRRLADERKLGRGRHVLSWDGRTEAGGVAAEGLYRARVALPSEARAVVSARPVLLDLTRPAPRIVSVTPIPGRGASIRFSGRSARPPLFRVYRTDRGDPSEAVEVARFRAEEGARTGRWDGLADGRPAPEGIYAFAVTVRDPAGNVGSAPKLLPPTAEQATEGSGVSVTRISVAGPLEPLAAGADATFTVRTPLDRFRWSLSRVGAARPIATGTATRERLDVALPRRAPTGLYALRIEATGDSALFPVAVRGRSTGRDARRELPLVVLPTITWQGLNQIDDDRDGFAETLDTAGSVGLDRPFALGDAPSGYREEVEPLLAFLATEGMEYELTTDLALARGTGPTLAGRRGVVLAGGARWLPQALLERLNRYTRDGGRLATFGADDLRRRVELQGEQLSDPTPIGAANVLGERTRRLRIAPAPLVVTGDRIGLFARTDGFVGLFSRFEETERLPAGATVVAAGERERPAVVAYRLGRGLVVRVGARGFSAALVGTDADPEVASVTRSLWTLLSR